MKRLRERDAGRDRSAANLTADSATNTTANATNESANNTTAVNKIAGRRTARTIPRSTGGRGRRRRPLRLRRSRLERERLLDDRDAQLEDGGHYGQRYHIRLYESPVTTTGSPCRPTRNFDWFTLQHRVHGSQSAQRKVESNFMAHYQVDVQEDSRIYLDNGNSSDADGWATSSNSPDCSSSPRWSAYGPRARRRRCE